MYYYSLNNYLLNKFGTKVYKLSLNGNMTCPNRDGKIDTRGCIFCSRGGSGDFTPCSDLDINEQIEQAKKKVCSKFKGNKYIAYFQSFTNTYAPVEYLKELFQSVIKREDIVALSIATRPDCISDDVVELIGELNLVKPVWIELGFQTSNEDTAKYIRRGYDNNCFLDAVEKLKTTGVHIVGHVILGLPNERDIDMFNTIDFISNSGINGIKIHLLHVLRDTDLYDEFKKDKFKTLDMEQYIKILAQCIERLSKDIVIHRMTGDGPKNILESPMWSANKKVVLNSINKYFKDNDIVQGKLFNTQYE